MQAIILAAGMGRRLGELTKDNTKCMIRVNGEALIDRVIHSLSELLLSRIVLVIGYEGERLRNYVGEESHGIPICYVYNPVYHMTNNIYSLYLAKDYFVEEDTLLLESDLIFEPTILNKILDDPFPNLVTVAKFESWMDGTVVKLDEFQKIQCFIPKEEFLYSAQDSYYKTVNIYKFSKEFIIRYYLPFLEAYTKALGNNSYYEEVLRVITWIDKVELKALLIDKEKWYEIDDVQDLDIAEALFASDNEKLLKFQCRYGGYWRFPKILDFCYLVNPYFPPRKLIEEMVSNFPVLLTEYPSGMSINSMLAAKYTNVKSDYICVGNGAAELIKILMESLDGCVGMIFPTFEEYPNRIEGDRIIPYIPTNKNFQYSCYDLQRFFSEHPIENLLIVNPDNPSGNYLPMNELLLLIRWAKQKEIKVIVDESFVDFSQDYGNNSLLNNDLLEGNPNLVVVKSISKSYGVPGLRLGFLASGDCYLINKMKKDVSIWNINSFAEYYMQIFSKYSNSYKEACVLFMKERERFYLELSTIPFFRVISSKANYFLIEIVNTYTSNQLISLLLDKYNILIKDCSNKKGFPMNSNYIRIAIRNKKDNDCLVNILKNLYSD